MYKQRSIQLCFFVLFMCACSMARADNGGARLTSSDEDLEAAYNWAREQALAYVFHSESVGDWYEAALPGRESFCMRDVAHQAMGAQALGLERHTLNMLRLFAASIAESRDWTAYWEITRHNRPYVLDYQSDFKYRYNLPANFDVLDCCFRMYSWTGDPAYLEDPDLLNFYRRTVTDYVERWDLGLDKIMTRRRMMNIKGRPDPENRFHIQHGIPSYNEGRRDFVLAVDQLAVQYAGYLAYARLLRIHRDVSEADVWFKKAQETKEFLNGAWWDGANQRYFSFLTTMNYQLVPGGLPMRILYNNAAEEGHKTLAAVKEILDDIDNESSPNSIGGVGNAVEDQSHLPEVLYRYGEAEAAYAQILELSSPRKKRREYPEVSYSVVGAIVTGLMGINVHTGPVPEPGSEPTSAEANRIVETLPRLTSDTEWARIADLPIWSNKIVVRHDRNAKTILVNSEGPAFIWHACFPGNHGTLLVNGEPRTASKRVAPDGDEVSWVGVVMGSGGTARVEAPEQ